MQDRSKGGQTCRKESLQLQAGLCLAQLTLKLLS